MKTLRTFTFVCFSFLCLLLSAQICYAKPPGSDPTPTTVENTPNVNVVSLPSGAIPVVVENIDTEKIPVEVFAPKIEPVRQRFLLSIGTTQVVGTDQIFQVPFGYIFVLKVLAFDANIDEEPLLNHAKIYVRNEQNENVFYQVEEVKMSPRVVYGKFDDSIYLKSGDRILLNWGISGDYGRTTDMILRISLSGYLIPE